MKYRYLLIVICIGWMSALSAQQEEETITTLDFIQVQDSLYAETFHYYENNWKKLREMALKEDIIHSYRMHRVTRDEDAPFDLILVTTYADSSQFALREDNFGRIMENRPELDLLNEHKPADFRKILFSKEASRTIGSSER